MKIKMKINTIRRNRSNRALSVSGQCFLKAAFSSHYSARVGVLTERFYNPVERDEALSYGAFH